MSEHDPLCRCFKCHHPREDDCDCAVIEAARADEREKAAQRVNIAVGGNGPLFHPDKESEVIEWWGHLVADVRNGGAA